ncbi:hypothetical protein AAEX63_16020 [Luteococcus sp. H138]|uniref:hypothetical protein n=1 Tax=unclassified Luteococcus TaxID=2639923 RepID=UPI00313EF891
MAQMVLSPALSVFDDVAQKARQLRAQHESWMESGKVPNGVREVVRRGWQRPSVRAACDADVLPEDQARERITPGLKLVMPLLRERLLPLAESAGCQLVACDAEGVVVGIVGPRMVRDASDRLGFVMGANWSEQAVGLNALGTAMVERQAVQLFGPEHSNDRHHGWVCTGAPVQGGGHSQPLGAFTVSGPLLAAHPHTLALVASVADEARRLLDEAHRADVERQTPLPSVPGRHVILDEQGFVLRSEGFPVSGRVVDARTLQKAGIRWLDGLGFVQVGRWAAGWVLREHRTVPLALTVVDGARPSVELATAAGSVHISITPRQRELLSLLAGHPAGLDARRLASAFTGDAGAVVTVRAEVSRLRSRLGPVLASRPYRLTVPATFCNPVPTSTG